MLMRFSWFEILFFIWDFTKMRNDLTCNSSQHLSGLTLPAFNSFETFNRAMTSPGCNNLKQIQLTWQYVERQHLFSWHYGKFLNAWRCMLTWVLGDRLVHFTKYTWHRGERIWLHQSSISRIVGSKGYFQEKKCFEQKKIKTQDWPS